MKEPHPASQPRITRWAARLGLALLATVPVAAQRTVPPVPPIGQRTPGGNIPGRAPGSGNMGAARHERDAIAADVITHSTVPHDREVKKPGGVVDAALMSVPPQPRAEYERALRLAARKDYRGSVKHLRKAVAAYPQFARAWLLLGVVCQSAGCDSEAELDLTQAVGIDPKMPEAYIELARLDLAHRNLAALSLVTRSFLTVAPEVAEAHFYRACALIAEGQVDGAEQDLLKARELAGTRIPEIWLTLTNLYERENRLSEAVSVLRGYLLQEPSGPRAERVRAELRRLEQR